MSNPEALANFLGALRVTNRAVPINAAEALLLIASGIDNVPDLQQAMRDANGNALPASTISRLISLLRGRARYNQGRWLESPYSLLEVRPHPHRKGLQLLLSEAGKRLIHHHFGAYTCTNHLGAELSTCDEKSKCPSI